MSGPSSARHRKMGRCWPTIEKWAISGPPPKNGPLSANQQNAISIAFYWQANSGPRLNAGWVINGILNYVTNTKKLVPFWIRRYCYYLWHCINGTLHCIMGTLRCKMGIYIYKDVKWPKKNTDIPDFFICSCTLNWCSRDFSHSLLLKASFTDTDPALICLSVSSNKGLTLIKSGVAFTVPGADDGELPGLTLGTALSLFSDDIIDLNKEF